MNLKSLLLYILKCLTGCWIVLGLAALIHFKDPSWCLISAVLVLSPDSKEAVPLALTRIKANCVGATASLICLLITPASVVTFSICAAATIVLCHLLKAMPGVRSALAAVIIIMLHEVESYHWTTAMDRMAQVISGCVLGLVVTFLFHRQWRDAEPPSHPEATSE